MINNNLYHAQQKKYFMYDSSYHYGLGDLGWPEKTILFLKISLNLCKLFQCICKTT